MSGDAATSDVEIPISIVTLLNGCDFESCARWLQTRAKLEMSVAAAPVASGGADRNGLSRTAAKLATGSKTTPTWERALTEQRRHGCRERASTKANHSNHQANHLLFF
jgi:hypothetical protein